MKAVGSCYDYLCKLSLEQSSAIYHYSLRERFWYVIGPYPFFYPETAKAGSLKVKRL